MLVKLKDPHFFTTTLGEAQEINARKFHGIKNINELLERRAGDTPNLPAVGMGIPRGPHQNWDAVLFTYRDLLECANAAAHYLSEKMILTDVESSGPVVALLSDSSIDMLVTFLGLLHIGCTVLLIAPQCDSKATQHLLTVTNARNMFYSNSLSSLATSSALPTCCNMLLPQFLDISTYRCRGPFQPLYHATPETTGYIHHTSGTTTGRPLPVPQFHGAATKYLPHLPLPNPVATLTTTPLYHGGVADLWRSMMSESMIWFYPPTVPMTADNIMRAVSTAEKKLPHVPVKLFTGVPYIQKICAEDTACLEMLKQMDMVGVGGASLPLDLGNFMVQQGVKLVSRFGSSECGFLLNSYRDFTADPHWNYLRLPANSRHLHFEPYSDSLFELVVLPGWPLMAKTNRPDGSFATSDLFTAHPTIRGAYRYETRADSTIVLTNGKKFDPTPLEEAVHRIKGVDEAIIIGQNRDHPGILVFISPSSRHRGDEEALRQEVVKSIKESVSSASSFAAVEPEMVILYLDGRSWPRSSKGTAIRTLAEKEFKDDIEAAYLRFESANSASNVPKVNRRDRKKVTIAVARSVEDVVGRDVMGEEDLFQSGVDSVMAIAIRKKLMDEIDMDGETLPGNVVFQQRTINGIIEFLTGVPQPEDTEHQHQEMRDLVREYSKNIPPKSPVTVEKPPCVILTGATGFLGSHILSQLVHRKVSRVYCLIRASNDHAALTRLQICLLKRNLSHILSSINTTIIALAANLSSENLINNPIDFASLASDATTIIHAAWPVNFLLPLATFRSAFAGVRNLALLANSRPKAPKHFVFCSSVASVINRPSSPIPETHSDNPADASPLGYSQSKWVAEQIVRAAGGDVVRIGQLSADRKNGMWNDSEAWPQLLKTVEMVGCLPDLDKAGEVVTWLPVDIAAEVVVKIATREGKEGGVYTVANAGPVEWKMVIQAMQKVTGGVVETADPGEWVKRLEMKGMGMGSEVKLMQLWKDTYGRITENGKMNPGPKFEMTNTANLAPEMGSGIRLDGEYLDKLIGNLDIVKKSLQ